MFPVVLTALAIVLDGFDNQLLGIAIPKSCGNVVELSGFASSAETDTRCRVKTNANPRREA